MIKAILQKSRRTVWASFVSSRATTPSIRECLLQFLVDIFLFLTCCVGITEIELQIFKKFLFNNKYLFLVYHLIVIFTYRTLDNQQAQIIPLAPPPFWLCEWRSFWHFMHCWLGQGSSPWVVCIIRRSATLLLTHCYNQNSFSHFLLVRSY